MNNPENIHCYELYQRHVKLLTLQGKAKSTIDSYSRAIRRISKYFDCCPDELTPEQLQDYFADMVKNHSWSMVKIDRLGLQFYWKHILKKDWQWINIVKPPYSLFFACVSSTLKDFGLNPDKLGVNMGMTAVLHTHSRKLDYHPHLHVVVPGGGIDKLKKQWKKFKGKYLFNAFSLAKVFRARFLDALTQKSFSIPSKIPDKWVVDCAHVGKGLPALKYLSRYLYRGVISEKNIVANHKGLVTFKYTEGKTGKTQYRTLKGEDFLHLIFQHVLPKGFRRVRDYGFLHPNAKKLLSLVQLILNVIIEVISQRARPVFKCPKCQSPMAIIMFRRPNKSG